MTSPACSTPATATMSNPAWMVGTGPSGLDSIAMPEPASANIAAQRATSAMVSSVKGAANVVDTHRAFIAAASSTKRFAQVMVADMSSLTTMPRSSWQPRPIEAKAEGASASMSPEWIPSVENPARCAAST